MSEANLDTLMLKIWWDKSIDNQYDQRSFDSENKQYILDLKSKKTQRISGEYHGVDYQKCACSECMMKRIPTELQRFYASSSERTTQAG